MTKLPCVNVKLPHFILLLLALCCCLVSIEVKAQVKVDQDIVYMDDGSRYQGKVISVSPTTLLIQIGDQIRSLDATKVTFIKRNSVGPKKQVVQAPTAEASKPKGKREFKPLDRRALIEMRTGLALIQPFGLEATIGVLNRLGPKSALGAQAGFMLSQRSVFSGFLEYRRYFSDPKVSRFFVGLRPGITYLPELFNGQSFPIIEYSPLKFMGAQCGWLFDSGYGIAGSMQVGLNYIWFTETTSDFDQFGNPSFSRVIEYQLVRPQASVSLIF